MNNVKASEKPLNLTDRHWFSVSLASEYSGLSERSLRRAIQKGKLKANRTSPGSRYIIHRRHLDAYLLFGRCRLNEAEKQQLAEIQL